MSTVAWLTGCARPTAVASLPERPNIVVVLVDTLRADRLSLYGYGRPTSPQLDRFAAERGVVFRAASTNAGCTYPSVNSLLTGLDPHRILARLDDVGFAIPPEMPSLAERLRAAGYSTAAISASLIVRATPSRYNGVGGFDRGFERFDESCLMRGAGCVNGRAFLELDRLAEPFLLYLHYVDPHSPYQPPAAAPRPFSVRSRAAARAWARRGEPWKIQRKLYDGEVENEFDADDVRHLSDLYDDSIHYFDGRFGELVAELDRRGLRERTVIALVADHGEELYDHGEWAHCGDLAYETILATPFVVAVPGLDAGERRSVVSNVDLTPTLLELAGVAVQADRFDGRSLVPLLSAGDAGWPARPAFALQGRMRVVRDGASRVALDLKTGARTSEPLGTSAVGPGEGDLPAGATEPLARALDQWLEAMGDGGRAAALEDSERSDSMLRAVGYL